MFRTPSVSLAAHVRRWLLGLGAEVGEGVRVEGRVWLPGRGGRVVIGARARLGGACAPIELRAEQGAALVLGEDVVVEEGCSIEATERVQVGARCRLGAFSKVLDNHFHEVAGDWSRRPPAKPVVIEPDCVIGPHAILLPGAWLGRGSRVGPATVVSRRVPPGTMVAGSPPQPRRLP